MYNIVDALYTFLSTKKYILVNFLIHVLDTGYNPLYISFIRCYKQFFTHLINNNIIIKKISYIDIKAKKAIKKLNKLILLYNDC